jgi:hypothetical protein
MSNSLGAKRKMPNIGLHALSSLANLPASHRYELIAEGLPIILASAQDLMAAAEALENHGRAADLLERQAGEEAAKILILLDYLRCPPGRSDRAALMLRNFYDHGARLLYDDACTWKPVDIAMLRSYIDAQRASHYVEESAHSANIFPNWNLHLREAALYADLGRPQPDMLSWSDPILWGSGDRLKPNALSVSETMQRLGFFKSKALEFMAEIWTQVNFIDSTPWEVAADLVAKTLQFYIDKDIISEDATDDDVWLVQKAWQMPMYDFDFKLLNIPLEDLTAMQRISYSSF